MSNTNLKQLSMKSLDNRKQNIEQIAQLFPHVLTETMDENNQLIHAIDFDLLKQELSDALVEGDKERYQLTWPGKKEAILTANTPIDKTLRPIKEDSVDWDNTQNLYIEGDNLEVLKLLQESYLNKVKMIYIDPPYNTGKDFIYKDDFRESTEEYLSESGQIDKEGNRLFQNTESRGRFHSDWLTMMFSRLKIAKNLLSEDGCIIVHIDEHEIANLRRLLDDIFGADNLLGEVIWDKGNPKGDATGVAYQHELVLAYAKNTDLYTSKNPLMRSKKNGIKILNKAKELFLKIGGNKLPDELIYCVKKYKLSKDLFEEFCYTVSLETINKDFSQWIKKQDFSGGETAYSNIDENGDVYQSVSMAWPNKKKAPEEYFSPLNHPITGKSCPVPDRGWRNPVKTMNELLERGLIVFGPMRQPNREENIY